MNIHRDAYTIVVAMAILAGVIAVFLLVVNPIR